MTELFGRIISNIRDGSSAAHSYIIEGPHGKERDGFIRSFAKSVLCENLSSEGRACGICSSCRQINAGTCMDLVYMERSGKTGYVVEDASTFMSRIGMGAYGSRIVGIIEEADLLSEVVQNKLLKTLEEPEEGVIIIIAVSSADKLLSTVRSRCVKLRMDDCVDADAYGEEQTAGVENFVNQFFYKYRDAVTKHIKSAEDALALLNGLEDLHRDEMVAGRDSAGHAAAIELIEQARMDIYKGMQYGKVLKRLHLELAE